MLLETPLAPSYILPDCGSIRLFIPKTCDELLDSKWSDFKGTGDYDPTLLLNCPHSILLEF